MEAVAQHGEKPVDIVLLDIQMPGLNGIEGVKVLRRHFRAARFLIVSGTLRAGRHSGRGAQGHCRIPAEVRRCA